MTSGMIMNQKIFILETFFLHEMSKMSNSAKTSRIGHHFAPLDELNTNPSTEIRFLNGLTTG